MALLERLEGSVPKEPKKTDPQITKNEPQLKQKPLRNEFESKLLNYLVDELKKYQNPSDDKMKELIKELADPFIVTEGERLTFEKKQALLSHVEDELLGYGPITPYLEDADVSEVMVNGPSQIYVERNGKLTLTDATFHDDEHVMRIIEKIISPLGRRLDESTPMVDARLPDGSRVNAIIPPLSLNGPIITIRKFSATPFTIHDLINFGTLSKEMAEFLDACVKANLNIVVGGGTGSGKTSTLNVISSFIPNNQRIVTIEDAAELKLSQKHVLSLETRPPNIEGKGAIQIRDLVRNSLRMRPDRIVIGEVRGAEALDMLQAMNTGHDGSLGTGHANSPRELLSRLETMVLMAGVELPLKAIREQIAGGIDLIIHQSRLQDGSRKITHITEVIGMEGQTIVLQDLFAFHQTGLDSNGKVTGQFKSLGIRPHFSEKFEGMGIPLKAEWFKGDW